MSAIEKLLQTMQEQFSVSLNKVRAEAGQLVEASQAAAGGKIEDIAMCSVDYKFTRGTVRSFASNVYASAAVCVAQARSALMTERAALEARHADNVTKLANNVEVVRRVKLLMTSLGIAESRTTYGYATPRARKMTTTKVTAGYVGDLVAVCKTSDNYDACVRALNDFEKQIQRFEQEELQKERLEAQKVAEARAARERLVLLGGMAHKYGCGADYDQLVETLCNKDKYFALGYWLERNRTNWQDGYARAEQGLAYFSVESAEDAAIVASIRETIDKWDGDGRAFRDALYGYGTMYALAAPDILADFEKLREAGLVPTD